VVAQATAPFFGAFLITPREMLLSLRPGLNQSVTTKGVSVMNIKKNLIASSVALVLGTPTANAALVTDLFGAYTWATDSANFTMLSGLGNTVGGTNDVGMTWDGNGYSANSDYTGPGSAGNVTAGSTTAFFGYIWTAHDIQVFTPGTYTFDVTLGGGVSEVGTLNATVGAGQLGMHMLFDWNGGLNNDVFVVASASTVFGAGIGRSSTFTTSLGNNCDGKGSVSIINCLYDGKNFGSAGKPTGGQTWMLASVDGNADGVMGIPMATGGPFAGFNANFNANLAPTPKVVPIPATAWLFGSGLLGLISVARRKRST
jgi:hypothetical protein